MNHVTTPPRGEMTTAFSSDGEAVLTRRVDPAPSSRSAPVRSEDQILSYYEIERCIQFIVNHGCSYVSLVEPLYNMGSPLCKLAAEKYVCVCGCILL